MRAGQLRHRGVIQTPTETRDAIGGVVQSWGTFATRWVAIEPLKAGSKEFYDAHHFQSEVTHVIRMHYTSGITPKMRVSARSRIFEIKYAINTDEKDRETILFTVERQ